LQNRITLPRVLLTSLSR